MEAIQKGIREDMDFPTPIDDAGRNQLLINIRENLRNIMQAASGAKDNKESKECNIYGSFI